MFKVNLNQFDTATQDLNTVHQDVRVAAERTSAVNVQFMSLMMGTWAAAENAACVQLEGNLRIFNEALDVMTTNYTNAGTYMRGTLVSQLSNVMTSIDGSISDANLIQRDESFCIANAVTFVTSSYDNLKTATNNAISSTSELDNSTDIVSALNDLNSTCDTQKPKVERVGTTYQTFSSSVDTFEDTYSALLDPQKFITQDMADAASAAMSATFAKTPLGQSTSFLKDLKSKYLSPFKKYGNAIAKMADQLQRGVDNVKYVAKEFGLIDSFVTALQNYDCTGDLVYALKSGAKEITSRNFLTATKNSVKNWWSSLSKNKGAWNGLSGKLSEGFGLFRGSELKEVGKNGSLAKVWEAGADVLDEPGVKTITKWGDHAKKFFRGVGFVGDAIEVGGYVSDTVDAFYSHEGDTAEKFAAGVVQVGESIAKFGVGKAIGAGIGFLCGGGPVGAVAGAVIGSWVDDKLKGVWKAFDESGAKESMIDGVGNFFRDTFGGGKKSAFAVSGS